MAHRLDRGAVWEYDGVHRGFVERLAHLEGRAREKVDAALREGRGVAALAAAYGVTRVLEFLQVSRSRYQVLVSGGRADGEEARRINERLRVLNRDLARVDQGCSTARAIEARVESGLKRAEGEPGVGFRIRIQAKRIDVEQWEALVQVVEQDGRVSVEGPIAPCVFKDEATARVMGREAVVREVFYLSQGVEVPFEE